MIKKDARIWVTCVSNIITSQISYLFKNSHINSYSDGLFVRWVDLGIPGTTLSRLFLSIHLVSLQFRILLISVVWGFFCYSIAGLVVIRLLFYSSILMIFIFWLANSFFIVDIFLLFTKSPPRTICYFFAINSFQNVQE